MEPGWEGSRWSLDGRESMEHADFILIQESQKPEGKFVASR